MSPQAARISIVAARARNGVIGSKGDLPWRLAADLRRFKALTLGHPVIMGRKTYESIVQSLGSPLPGRENIVISRSATFSAAGCRTADSLQKALGVASCAPGAAEAFVIGGEEIYRLALPVADRMHITEIDADFEGDAHFPHFSLEEWRESSRESGPAGNSLQYSFVIYERRQPTTSG